jgi:hypothetical protein
MNAYDKTTVVSPQADFRLATYLIVVIVRKKLDYWLGCKYC